MGTTDGKPHSWHGYSFKGDVDGKFFNVSLGAPKVAVASFQPTLPTNTMQWWYETVPM